MTPLDKTLKRAITIDGQPYVLTLDAEGVTITEKGKRKGQSLKWKELLTGEAALSAALKASVASPAAGTEPA
jgi:hypothetical protein